MSDHSSPPTHNCTYVTGEVPDIHGDRKTVKGPAPRHPTKDRLMAWHRLTLLPALLLAAACTPRLSVGPVGAAAATGFRNADDSVLAASLELDGMRATRGRVTVLAPADSMSAAALVALADTLQRGYQAISELLRPARDWHRYDAPLIRIYLGPRSGGALTDARSRIFFPLSWTRESRTTLLHEMAHVFLMPRRPMAFETTDAGEVSRLLRERAFWFDEGMAEYAAQLAARQIGFPAEDPWGTNYASGLGAACAGWAATPGSTNALANVGQPGPPVLQTRVEIGTFYVCSHSFVAFLVDHIGLRTTLTLGATDDIDTRLRQVTPNSLAEWRDRWSQSLGR